MIVNYNISHIATILVQTVTGVVLYTQCTQVAHAQLSIQGHNVSDMSTLTDLDVNLRKMPITATVTNTLKINLYQHS